MPRYFFHYWNGIGLEEDSEGLELADVDAAHARALDMATEILEHCDDLSSQTREGSAFEIVDEEGHIVLFVSLRPGKEQTCDDNMHKPFSGS
jgi:hypothetical protein